MKRAAIVLFMFFAIGMTGLAGLAYLPRHTPSQIYTSLAFSTLFVVGFGVLGMVMVGFLLIFPHELGHYIAARKFGFSILFFEVLGFRLWFLDDRLALRFAYTRNFAGIVYFGKSEASLSEIRWSLVAGPLANLVCGLSLIGLDLIFGRMVLLDPLIFGHLFLFVSNILPLGKVRDGARILQSYKEPNQSVALFNLAYASIRMQRLRPNQWELGSMVTSGDPIQDIASDLYHVWHHMDADRASAAEPYMRNALKLVQANKLKFEPAATVCAEAAIYFTRYQVDVITAQEAMALSKNLKLTPNQRYMINGGIAWLESKKALAIDWWKKSNDLYMAGVVFDVYRDYGRDWFLRLRTENMIFETDRLFARPWTMDDLDVAFDTYRRMEVMQYLGRDPKPIETIEEATEMMNRWMANQAARPEGQGAWAIVRKHDEKPIGTIMCKALPNNEMEPSGELEIGWHLTPEAWGHGYATESALGVIEYAFRKNPDLQRVLAVIYPVNQASQNVAKRLGMTHLGMSNNFYGMPLELFELLRPATEKYEVVTEAIT